MRVQCDVHAVAGLTVQYGAGPQRFRSRLDVASSPGVPPPTVLYVWLCADTVASMCSASQPDPTKLTVTSFGSLWLPANRAVSALRAHALRHGAELRPAPLPVTAPAVIAADLWMRALGADTLTTPARFGSPAVAALSAILARAAGHPEHQPAQVAPATCPEGWLVAVELYREWTQRIGVATSYTLKTAAADLAHGAADPTLAAASALLVTASEEEL